MTSWDFFLLVLFTFSRHIRSCTCSTCLTTHDLYLYIQSFVGLLPPSDSSGSTSWLLTEVTSAFEDHNIQNKIRKDVVLGTAFSLPPALLLSNSIQCSQTPPTEMSATVRVFLLECLIKY